MVDKLEMAALVMQLNEYRDAYYNNNVSLVSDKEYDDLFDKLVAMEEELGVVLPVSPTQTVGYTVQSKLNKVSHDHPMLSLGKTKDVNDIVKFANTQSIIAMLKMDGLTCSIKYVDGNLVSAETRGNGAVGEDITENIKQVANVPKYIDKAGTYVIDGEVIVDYDAFNKVNSALDNKFSHPRNYASGSIRQLDTRITHDRNLSFIAWKVIAGTDYTTMFDRLHEADVLGFTTVPMVSLLNGNGFEIMPNVVEDAIADLREDANEYYRYPIDGIVFAYDDIEYGESLGETSHHPRHSIAYKFYDDEYETTLRDIEWTPTRTGMLAPVAIFDEVDLNGAMTSRASLSNVSIIKELKLGIGDTITVARMNEVIPKVTANITMSDTYEFPTVCPVCGAPLELRKDGIAEMLYCTNDSCESKQVARLVHFASKACMNIDGLSEGLLTTFVRLGYVTDYKSIYHLDNYADQIPYIDGFGTKSFAKLITAIDNSRHVKLENFINALGINQIGAKASKVIAKFVNGSWDTFKNAVLTKYDFSRLDDFGPVANKAIYDFFTEDTWAWVDTLVDELTFDVCVQESHESFATGKTFVVTGKFNSMTRDEIETLITNNGGKLASAVSTKTDFLLTNDAASGSGKAKKAMELSIAIMSEEEFLNHMK